MNNDNTEFESIIHIIASSDMPTSMIIGTDTLSQGTLIFSQDNVTLKKAVSNT